MISITVFIVKHDEEGLERELDRKFLIQEGTSEKALGEATRTEKKNRALGKFFPSKMNSFMNCCFLNHI